VDNIVDCNDYGGTDLKPIFDAPVVDIFDLPTIQPPITIMP
jgi:hypothetical protein